MTGVERVYVLIIFKRQKEVTEAGTRYTRIILIRVEFQ